MSGPGRLAVGALIGAALAALVNIAGPQYFSSATGEEPIDVTISRPKPTMTVTLINTPSNLPDQPSSSVSSSSSSSSSTTTTTTTTKATTVTTTTTQAPQPTTTTQPPRPTTTTTTKKCGLIFC